MNDPVNLHRLAKLIVAALILLTGACREPLSPAEAKKHLRAFDNELIQLTRSIGETTGYRALAALSRLKNAPFPYLFHPRDEQGNIPVTFEFDKVKGLYRYDRDSALFRKIRQSDSIIMIFPFISDHDSVARLVITEYTECSTRLGMNYPLKIRAFLTTGKIIALRIDHEGQVEHGIPVFGRIRADFSGFSIDAVLNTRLTKEYGKVKLNLELYSEKKRVLEWETRSRVSVAADTTLVYKSIDMDMKVFPVRIEVHVDRDSIAARSIDPLQDFNDHLKITLYSMNTGRYLGSVSFRERPGNDKLNPAITYHDGSSEFVEDFLIMVRKILNFKL